MTYRSKRLNLRSSTKVLKSFSDKVNAKTVGLGCLPGYSMGAFLALPMHIFCGFSFLCPGGILLSLLGRRPSLLSIPVSSHDYIDTSLLQKYRRCCRQYCFTLLFNSRLAIVVE